MKVAIMQPYVFPYIGYFQLIEAVDTFVFLDDVNFIKKGWINRNRILINHKDALFTIPLKKASQNKLINEVEVLIDNNWVEQFYKTLEHNYKNAPNFNETFELVQVIFSSKYSTISDLAINSVKHICLNLGIDKNFQLSSNLYGNTKGQEKSERLINIVKQSNNRHYINPKGGVAMYDKEYFKLNEVELSFIDNELLSYKQFNNSFVEGLSIIDVLMFNSNQEIVELLKQYKLI